MPRALRDWVCTLVPIPKPHKDPSLSDSYRPIALAPNLSKVLELMQYHHCFVTCNLQFGFEQGFSTSLCTSVLKNVVSKYIHRGLQLMRVKAFDQVNHKLLLNLLLKKNVPTPILRFLFSWYQSQILSVRWDPTLSWSIQWCQTRSPLTYSLHCLHWQTPYSSVQVGHWLLHRISLCWCFWLCSWHCITDPISIRPAFGMQGLC